MAYREDLVGRTFGEREVVEFLDVRGGNAYWLVRCTECGMETERCTAHLNGAVRVHCGKPCRKGCNSMKAGPPRRRVVPMVMADEMQCPGTHHYEVVVRLEVEGAVRPGLLSYMRDALERRLRPRSSCNVQVVSMSGHRLQEE